MSLPFSKLKIFGKQVLNHIKDEEGPNSLNNLKNIYSQVKSDELMRILTSRLSESDLYKVIFISFLMNKGLEMSKIEKIVTNDLLLYKITNYDEPSTKLESCDDCGGYGNIECDNCEGDGDLICVNCDGTGEVDCDECGGSGEDEEGDSCASCSGNGKDPCNDCYGDGRIQCDYCSGNGQDECSTCNGSGEVNSDEDFYEENVWTIITMDNYVLSVEENKILDTEVVNNLFNSDSLYIKNYRSNDFTLTEIESMYEGEIDDEYDINVLTSPPIKL
jgi:hypothetical protein